MSTSLQRRPARGADMGPRPHLSPWASSRRSWSYLLLGYNGDERSSWANTWKMSSGNRYAGWDAIRSPAPINPLLTESQEEKDPQHARRRHKWTKKHSFYAIMGGFAVDTADPSQDPYVRLLV